jgi:hypothetical protein
MFNLASLSLLCLVLVGQAQAAFPVRQIFQFPNSTYTDLENIGIRQNGQLLLNSISSPTTYILDPSASNPSARPIYRFPEATSTVGIAETSPDVFAVVVGNYSGFQGVKGSFSIWSIDLNPPTPVVAKIASIAGAEALNGMTTVPDNPDIILIADSALSAVWNLNIKTGASSIAIQNPQLGPTSSFPLGINGLHVRGKTLYFTNSAQGTYASLPITQQGTSAGSISIHASSPSSAPGDKYDDFALDHKGNAWIAYHPDSVVEVTTCGEQNVIAGGAVFGSPTSAIFGVGTNHCTLYVVTAGSESAGISGQVIEVSTC